MCPIEKCDLESVVFEMEIVPFGVESLLIKVEMGKI